MAQRVEHGVVLDRARDQAMAACLARPGRALERQVDRLRASGREDDLARFGVHVARDRVTCLIEGGARLAPVGVN